MSGMFVQDEKNVSDSPYKLRVFWLFIM